MRLFISVDFTEEILNVLTDSMKQLKKQSVSGGFTRHENLHLTLAFIGETEEKDVEKVIRCMEKIKMQPFEMSISGSGRFGDLWWVGIEKNEKLAQLADQLRKEIRSADLPVDGKKFNPHVTIARRVKPVRSHDDITLKVPRTTMTVNGFSLMNSERIAGKLTYTELFWKGLR